MYDQLLVEQVASGCLPCVKDPEQFDGMWLL
jgi:hypothetical protein